MLDPRPHPETGPAGELAFDVITELWFDDEAVFKGTLRYLTTRFVAKGGGGGNRGGAAAFSVA